MTKAHPGDSSIQKGAEQIAREALSVELGISLNKRKFTPPEGSFLEVDAASEAPVVLAEIWAHQGKPKSAQVNKVMSDLAKLVFARSLLPSIDQEDCRLMLCFTDDDAADLFRGNSWKAQAIRSANVEVKVIKLPEKLREQIRQAQARQYR